MNRKGRVFNNGRFAGIIEESESGYSFRYDTGFLADQESRPICVGMPKRIAAYNSEYLFPFFHGLLAEGVTSNIQCRQLKIDENDYFGRLLKTGAGDVIGSITVEEVVEK
jgi:HipA-like protein